MRLSSPFPTCATELLQLPFERLYCPVRNTDRAAINIAANCGTSLGR